MSTALKIKEKTDDKTDDNNDAIDDKNDGDKNNDDANEDKNNDVKTEEGNKLEKTKVKVKREYKKKVNIHEGEKDYKKWMAKLKTVKNRSGKMIIDRVNQTMCCLIIQHRNKLLKQGIDVAASVPAEETVNVPDSDDNKDYVNLDTVGGGM